MNDLIKITEKDGKRVVSARDLHEFLGATERFANWFERQLQFGFTENEDYVGCKEFNALANQELTNYAISIDMAKEISMIQKSEKGKQARQYFIACEKAAMENKPLASISDTLLFVDAVARSLNLNESSMLLMYQKTANVYGVPREALPSYTPSKGQLLSATDLLKRAGSSLSAKAFNCLMIGAGMMEEKERISSSKGIKKFKSLVGDGLTYGENQVSPNNPRETQALYYSETFLDLMELITK